MRDVIEVSYTGDLLAHRRCPRAWAYEKYARFLPYEQAQAMEGRLVHHAMEWMTQQYDSTTDRYVTEAELRVQLLQHYRVLWARGIKTGFWTKDQIVTRVLGNLFPSGNIHPTVKAAIAGAKHTEYELRTVKKIYKSEFAGKEKLVLTGVLDLVLQSQHPLTYLRTWEWHDIDKLGGVVTEIKTISSPNDLEVWDYKGTRAGTTHETDYVIQLLTYAGLYCERTGILPARCVLFYVNEQKQEKKLVAIPICRDIVERAERWTIDEAKRLRQTILHFEKDPLSLEGGNLEKRNNPVGERIDTELDKQCTACGQRFDCTEYTAYLARIGRGTSDVDPLDVSKN